MRLFSNIFQSDLVPFYDVLHMIVSLLIILTSDHDHESLVGNLEKHYTSILQASSDVSQSDGLKRSLRGSC